MSGDTRKQRTTSGEFPRLQTFLQDQILGIITIISGSLFEGFRKKKKIKKKQTNKNENGSSARFSVRLVHARGRVKAKTSAPSHFSAYLSGELQTHDEIRLDRCSLTRHFVVLCERIRGRHRVPKRLLIITNIIVGSATAVVTTGNSRRPLPWLSETNALAT